jgi:hypothetical protein
MDSWTMGRELEERMLELGDQRTNRLQEEQEEFLAKILHGVRSGRVAILAAPLLGKSRKQVYEALLGNLENLATKQTNETGYDARQTELYVEAHRRAFDSLADQLGLR